MKNVSYESILEDVGVLREDADDCMKWALGEGYKACDIGLAPLVWNERHGAFFRLSSKDNVILNIKRIGVAYRAFVKEEYINPAILYDLHASEKKFRKLLVKCFALERIKDPNEMMDILSWGLGYDDNLLRCHSYYKWPEAFKKNTKIEVEYNTPIEKCIRLLALKWKSKKKILVVRNSSNLTIPGVNNGG